MQTYRAGDTITLDVELTDVSGVGLVRAMFLGVEKGRQIGMTSDGKGQTSVTLTLTKKVGTDTLPDEYFLQMLAVRDKYGNEKEESRPEIKFLIESASDDRDAPEVISVNLR